MGAAENLQDWITDHPAFDDIAYEEVWFRGVGPLTESTINQSEELDAAMRNNMRVGVEVIISLYPSS